MMGAIENTDPVDSPHAIMAIDEEMSTKRKQNDVITSPHQKRTCFETISGNTENESLIKQQIIEHGKEETHLTGMNRKNESAHLSHVNPVSETDQAWISSLMLKSPTIATSLASKKTITKLKSYINPPRAWILATDTLMGNKDDENLHLNGKEDEDILSIPPSPEAHSSCTPLFKFSEFKDPHMGVQSAKVFSDSLKRSVQFALASQETDTPSPNSPSNNKVSFKADIVNDLNPNEKQRRKRAPHFSETEDHLLENAVAQYGENWDDVLKYGGFDDSVRTSLSLKSRWMRLNSKKKDSHSMPASPLIGSREVGFDSLYIDADYKQGQFPEKDKLLSPADWGSVKHSRQRTHDSEGPSRNDLNDISNLDQRSLSTSALKTSSSHLTPKTPTSQRHSTKKIHEYFQRTAAGTSPRIQKIQLDPPFLHHDKSGESSPKIMSSTEEKLNLKIESLEKEGKQKDERIKKLEEMVESLKKESVQAREEFTQASESIEQWRVKYDAMNKRFSDWAIKSKNVLVDTLRTSYTLKWRDTSRRVAENNMRLASMIPSQRGNEFQDCWQMGYVFNEIQDKLSTIQREKDVLDRRKKQLSKRLKSNGRDSAVTDILNSEGANGMLQSPNTKNEEGMESDTSVLEMSQLLEEEDIVKHRLIALKKEESDLLSTLDKLTIERNLHIRECRRIRDQDTSRFNSNPLLNERYLLLEMIGKGGFSEVYKAFDLVQLEIVACKIHSLNEHWSEERKASYMKHSSRECRIHQSLKHPNVVQMIDVFEYDALSFCTVLEFVDGLDLETHLKTVKMMPEKEARSVLVQIMQALKYMNELENPIIHYDLKPANILLRHGLVKVTDFGLSKILDSTSNSSGNIQTNGNIFKPREIELTSVGAGTYWYLPPEVLRVNSGAPIKISSKVDVWSLGCIFYEMLYGSKPFGNDMSQQRFLQEEWISHDTLNSPPFPSKPVVSNEAKQFIRRCLEYHRENRPDILTIAKDPYLQPVSITSTVAKSAQSKRAAGTTPLSTDCTIR